MKAARYPGIRVTANGNQLVSYHTETRIADAGVFYPITPSTEGGELFQQAYAEGKLNVFGGNTIAIETEGEHAAQGGAIAHSVCGKRVVNFTSGQGVVYGVEQYYHAPGKGSTMVLEVGARALTKHALNVHCGHDDIYGALDTGWIMIFGKDAQQAADQALILRRVTELSLTPGMNIMDGFLTTHLERTFYKHESELIREYLGAPDDIIDCPTEAQRVLFGATRRRVPKMMDLTNPVLLGPVQNQEHYMQGVVARRNNFAEPILEFLEDAYEEFAELTGRRYGLITEYKTEDADTVFVSLGSAAENIEAAVDYLRQTRSSSVGSVHVNVIRPFPEAALVNALKGKKNVIILERTDEALSGDNPLGRDIRTAFSKAVQGTEGLPKVELAEVPRFFGGSYGLGSRDFRPEHIIGAFEYATAGRARKDGKTAADGANFFVLGIDHPYSVIADEMPSLLPEGAVAVRFHSIGGWGAITTGKNLGAILGDLNDLLFERDGLKDELGNPKEVIHVSANPKYGSEKKGAPTSYFMVAAKDRIRVNCDLRHVTVVLCCDPKAFTHTNPLDGMQEGGCLVWESDVDGERAWQNLPIWARQQIIQKKIRVFTLPGFEIARKATDRADLQLRMQGNAFLGAFFAVSPMLQEFGITQEQFREVVHKQYVKKFGKLGDAVVQSNMEVMTAGLRAREGDRHRRKLPRPITPASAARRCCRFLKSCVRNLLKRPASTVPAAVRTPLPEGQGPRTPISPIKVFDAEFRSHFGYDQPATPLSAMGVIARPRRYGVKICCPPRNTALHSRKLHAVHGVHLGLPGYGAAQLLAGSRHNSRHRRHALCRRSRRAPKDARQTAGDRKAYAPAHVSRDQAGHSDADHRPRGHGVGGRILAAAKKQFYSIIEKVPMAYQKTNANFQFVTQASNCILPTYVVLAILEQEPRAYSAFSCSVAYGLNLDPVTMYPYQANPTGTAGVGYNGVNIETGGPLTFPIPTGYLGFNPSTAPNDGEGFAKDLGGNELPSAPPFTVSFGAQYTIPITTDWAGTLRGDYYWQDYSWARVFNDNPYDRIRGYTNVNLTLIFTNQNGWQVMLYDKNVFNETAITGDFLNSDDSGLTTNVFLTDPKLIGIRVTKNW